MKVALQVLLAYTCLHLAAAAATVSADKRKPSNTWGWLSSSTPGNAPIGASRAHVAKHPSKNLPRPSKVHVPKNARNVPKRAAHDVAKRVAKTPAAKVTKRAAKEVTYKYTAGAAKDLAKRATKEVAKRTAKEVPKRALKIAKANAASPPEKPPAEPKDQPMDYPKEEPGHHHYKSRGLKVKRGSTYNPLTDERLAAFCYLKHRLMHKYRKAVTRYDGLPEHLRGDNKRCALVSSSGAMRFHPHGQDIDNHDVVFRFNKAPTAQYANYVGGKTTYRLGWDFPAGCTQGCININGVGKFNATMSIKHIFPHAQKKGMTPHVTSGFHGMIVALSTCGSLDAYEMAPSAKAGNAPYSYYSNWNAKPGGALHNSWHGYMEEEHKLWSLISTTPKEIQLQHGKTSYKSFKDVVCPGEALLVERMKGETHELLEKLIGDVETELA